MEIVDEKSEPVQSVQTTGLAWGVRESFRSYVLRGAMGSETPDGSAGSLPDGRFYFPLAEATGFDLDALDGTLSFAGGVRFLGHGGMIDLRLGELELVLTDSRGVVRTGARDLVEVSVLQVAVGENSAALYLESRLAPGAEGLFNDVYAAGTLFDDLEVRISTP